MDVSQATPHCRCRWGVLLSAVYCLSSEYASVSSPPERIRSSNTVIVHSQHLLSKHCNIGVLFKQLLTASTITSFGSATKRAVLLHCAPRNQESMWWRRSLKNRDVTVRNRSAINASYGSCIGDCFAKLTSKRVQMASMLKVIASNMLHHEKRKRKMEG